MYARLSIWAVGSISTPVHGIVIFCCGPLHIWVIQQQSFSVPHTQSPVKWPEEMSPLCKVSDTTNVLHYTYRRGSVSACGLMGQDLIFCCTFSRTSWMASYRRTLKRGWLGHSCSIIPLWPRVSCIYCSTYTPEFTTDSPHKLSPDILLSWAIVCYSLCSMCSGYYTVGSWCNQTSCFKVV